MTEQKIHGRTIGQLIWRRFLKNKLGVIGGGVITLFFLVTVLAPFLATMDIVEQSAQHILAPPQKIHFQDEEGNQIR